MKTQILSLNLGMNLLDTIIKASKFVFLEVGLMPPSLMIFFFHIIYIVSNLAGSLIQMYQTIPEIFAEFLKNFTVVGIFFQRHCLKHSLDGHRAVRF